MCAQRSGDQRAVLAGLNACLRAGWLSSRTMREPRRAFETSPLRTGLFTLAAVTALLVGPAACTSAQPSGKAPGQPVSTTTAPVTNSPPPVPVHVGQSVKDVAGQPIPFGSARYFGGVRPSELGSGVIGIAASPDGRGYWLATANGAVFRYGDAKAYVSHELPKGHIVAIVASRAGGYWLASGTGQVFPFGDAPSYASTRSVELSTPIVAMAATPDGRGYWLAASGGEVFHYGDARFYGSSTPDLSHDHVVAMAAAPDGRGYWLAGSDGRVFSFGDARFHGSAAREIGKARIVAMVATRNARGYWLAASDGKVFSYGSARFYGSAAQAVRKNPVVAMAAAPDGRGYWLIPTSPPRPVGLPAPGPGFIAGHVTAIGDSVMLDAAPDLEADIPGIDVEAAVSRQWYEGILLAQQLKAEGRLGAIVVIDLGTNGPVSPQQFTAMMDVLAGASRVVFVTVHLPSYYSWSQSVNTTLREGVPRYPRDRLADFNKLADKNPQWFYGDGVHMPIGGTGARAMALLIKSQI